jgi:hypothetical protein
MGNNQNTWSHEINIIFHPLGSLAGFPARVIVLWQENVRGTRNASLASDRYNVVVDVVFKCLRQRFNGLDICLPAVFYMYAFSWFPFGLIKHLYHAGSENMKFYSPTSIIFPSVVALRKYDTLRWINFHISLTSMK